MVVPITTTPLTQDQQLLVTKATAVIDAITYPLPTMVNHSTVSSAILTSRGRIFTGVNMSHFTGGPCAEHVALGNALAGGIRSCPDDVPIAEGLWVGTGDKGDEGPGNEELETLVCIVAVLSRGRGVVNPCGKCRQILADYHPGIEVIVREGQGLDEVGVRKIEELLPVAYTWKKSALP